MTDVDSTSIAADNSHDGLRLPSPALFLALAFALGVAFIGSAHGSSRELLWLIPAFMFAAGSSLLAAAVLLQLERYRLVTAATVTGFVFAGATAALLFGFRFPPNHISHLGSWGIDVEHPVNVEGWLRTDCVVTPNGCEFELAVTALYPNNSSHRQRVASGRVQVQVTAGRGAQKWAAPELRSGDHVLALIHLRQPHTSLNPGSFDFRERAASIEDLYWEGAVEDPAQLQVLSARRAPATERAIERVRAGLRRAVDRLYPPWSVEGRDGAVLKAILLGERTSLDSATIDHFRVSGLYHLLGIAGLHVGLIAALILGLLRLTSLRRHWRNLILLIALLAYALVVEQRAPTLRATLMLVIFVVAQFVDRDHNALNSLGLAALFLLMTRPAWLFESGFQLSFAAALLIVGLAAPALRMSVEPYRRALRHLEDVERDAAFEPRQVQFRLDLRMLVSALQRRAALLNRYPAFAQQLVVWPPRLILWLAGMVLFSAVLQIGLLLPMVEQFHRVTLAGVGLNALALPLMGVLLAVAIPTVLSATLVPSVAVWLAKALTVVFHALFAIAEWPHLPFWLSYRVPSPPLWLAIGFAISLVALAVSLGRHRPTSIVSLLAVSLLAVALATAPFSSTIRSGVFEVTALDCGAGEAAFLTLPDGITVLVGAGGAGRTRLQSTMARRWDPGENIVSPYLWSRRIKSLDVLVVTSAAGNLDGFVPILQNFRVGEVWFHDSDANMALILEEATRRHVPVRAISPGETLKFGTTTFEILAPADRPTLGTEPLIIRVASAETRAVLASGIPASGEQEIFDATRDAQSLVFATGKRTLVWASDPGAPMTKLLQDYYGVPPQHDDRSSSPTLHHRLFATDRDGAITVELKAGAPRVRCFHPICVERF